MVTNIGKFVHRLFSITPSRKNPRRRFFSPSPDVTNRWSLTRQWASRWRLFRNAFRKTKKKGHFIRNHGHFWSNNMAEARIPNSGRHFCVWLCVCGKGWSVTNLRLSPSQNAKSLPREGLEASQLKVIRANLRQTPVVRNIRCSVAIIDCYTYTTGWRVCIVPSSSEPERLHFVAFFFAVAFFFRRILEARAISSFFSFSFLHKARWTRVDKCRS